MNIETVDEAERLFGCGSEVAMMVRAVLAPRPALDSIENLRLFLSCERATTLPKGMTRAMAQGFVQRHQWRERVLIALRHSRTLPVTKAELLARRLP